MEKQFFSIKEAAAWSSLSARFLYELCQKRAVRFYRIGKRIVIARGDLEEFIKQGTVEVVDWDEKAGELLK